LFLDKVEFEITPEVARQKYILYYNPENFFVNTPIALIIEKRFRYDRVAETFKLVSKKAEVYVKGALRAQARGGIGMLELQIIPQLKKIIENL